MLKLKLIHLILCMVYKFQIKWLNKHKEPLIGDIITIINRLGLESGYEMVNVIDVNKKRIS